MKQRTLFETIMFKKNPTNSENSTTQSQKPKSRRSTDEKKIIKKFKEKFSLVSKQELKKIFFENCVKILTKKSDQKEYFYDFKIFSQSFKTYRFGFAAFILSFKKKFLVFTQKLSLQFEAETGLLCDYKLLPEAAIPTGFKCFVLSQNEKLILMGEIKKKIDSEEKLKIYDIEKNQIIFKISKIDGLKIACNYIFNSQICAMKVRNLYKEVKIFNIFKKQKSRFYVKNIKTENFNILNLPKSKYLIMKETSVHFVNSRTRKSLLIFDSDPKTTYKPIEQRNYNFYQMKKEKGVTKKFVKPEMFAKRPLIFMNVYQGKILVVGSGFVLNLFLSQRVCNCSWRGGYMKDFQCLKKSEFLEENPKKIFELYNSEIYCEKNTKKKFIPVDFKTESTTFFQHRGGINFSSVREFEETNPEKNLIFQRPEPKFPNLEKMKKTLNQVNQEQNSKSEKGLKNLSFPSKYGSFYDDEENYIDYEDDYYDNEANQNSSAFEYSHFQNEDNIYAQNTNFSTFTQNAFQTNPFSQSNNNPHYKKNSVQRINNIVEEHKEKWAKIEKELKSEKLVEMKILTKKENYKGFKDKVILCYNDKEMAFLGIGGLKKKHKFDLETMIDLWIRIEESLIKCLNLSMRENIGSEEKKKFKRKIDSMRNMCEKLNPELKEVILNKVDEWTYVEEKIDKDLSHFGFVFKQNKNKRLFGS